MEGLSTIWSRIQGFLFPYLEEVLDPLTERQKKLVAILGMPDGWKWGDDPLAKYKEAKINISKKTLKVFGVIYTKLC